MSLIDLFIHIKQKSMGYIHDTSIMHYKVKLSIYNYSMTVTSLYPNILNSIT